MTNNPYETVIARFLGGLEDRRRRMDEAVRVLAQADDAEARTSLRREAHRLAGTAGSMGFPDLGTAALALEEAVDGGETRERLLLLFAAFEDIAGDLRLEDSALLSKPCP